MSKSAINIDSVSKIYRPVSRTYRTLRDSIMGLFHPGVQERRQELTEVHALKRVSLDIKMGEIVGIIGNNGAGKSTLLKILSRVSPPTEGSIRIRGRVGSLLEVGTGFHPELTGRQNIFLNGTLLGMHRKEILRRFDEIVEFSEVRAFLDLPVKFYSSGMYMRLAFAVAAHLEPEILIIDEVLAVGDAAFQHKCIKKVRERGGNGGAIIFVSHSLDIVTSLCSRAIHLRGGELVDDGPAETVVSRYMESVGFSDDLRRWVGDVGDEHVRLIRTEILPVAESETLDTANEVHYQIEIDILAPTIGLYIALSVYSASERMLAYTAFDDKESGPAHVFEPGRYLWELAIPGNTFAQGAYVIRPDVMIANRKGVAHDVGALKFSMVNIRGIGRRYPDSRDSIIRPAWDWALKTREPLVDRKLTLKKVA